MKPHAVRAILCGVMLCASILVSVAADQLTVYPARKIVTMDPSMPTATVVAVRDDRIVAVGTMETLEPWLDAHEFEIDERLAFITLTRPEKLNAMTHEMLRGLWDAFTKVRDDDEVWLGIVTGEGRAFSVGHDLVEMSAGGKMADTPGSTDELYLFMATQVWKPVIAAVNGICLAQGAGVALGADIRVVADNVQFGWPQVKRGISSISGPVILSQRVPIGKALEILLTGEFISALTVRGNEELFSQLEPSAVFAAADTVLDSHVNNLDASVFVTYVRDSCPNVAAAAPPTIPEPVTLPWIAAIAAMVAGRRHHEVCPLGMDLSDPL